MTGLALTFDDGPDPLWTARLLDQLAALGARATFFPIAPRAAAQPQLLARMLAEGHEVGLHCYEHVRHTERDAAWLRHDTDRALAVLAELGVSAVLWRPPWGVTAPWTEEVAREHGLSVIGWSVDTHDWRGDDAESMLNATRAGLEPGAVVLAHDGIGPGALRSSCEETLRYVEGVAALAAAAGIVLRTLPLQVPA